MAKGFSRYLLLNFRQIILIHFLFIFLLCKSQSILIKKYLFAWRLFHCSERCIRDQIRASPARRQHLWNRFSRSSWSRTNWMSTFLLGLGPKDEPHCLVLRLLIQFRCYQWWHYFWRKVSIKKAKGIFLKIWCWWWDDHLSDVYVTCTELFKKRRL